MAKWKCSVSRSALEDARASLGPLADETFEVEADSADEALLGAKQQIGDRRPLTGLPSDLLDEWLVVERSDDKGR